MSSSTFGSWHRVPRANIDPIKSPADALAVIGLAVSEPLTDETAVILLDHERRGMSVVVVDGTTDDDAIITVVECIADAAPDELCGVVVATVRPHRRADDADIDTWLEASAVAEDAGTQLIEWFVISGEGGSRHVECPRELLGEPPRW